MHQIVRSGTPTPEVTDAFFSFIVRQQGAAIAARSKLMHRIKGAAQHRQLNRLRFERGEFARSIFSAPASERQVKARTLEGLKDMAQTIDPNKGVDPQGAVLGMFQMLGTLQGNTGPEAARRKLVRSIERTEAGLIRSAQTTDLPTWPSEVTVRNVAKQLADDEVLVVFFRTCTAPFASPGQASTAEYGAFIVHSASTHASFVPLGSSSEIDRLSYSFVDAVSQRTSAIADVKAIGRKLYSKIIAPIKPSLKGRRKPIIVADGSIFYLPIGALFDGRKWFYEAYESSRLAHVQQLSLRSKKRWVAEATVSAFIDPAPAAQGYRFAALNPSVYAPLPGARAELATLKALFGKKLTAQVGKAAEEAKLGRKPTDILHVASHGVHLRILSQTIDETDTPSSNDSARGMKRVGWRSDLHSRDPLRPPDDEVGWIDSALILAGTSTLAGAKDGFLTAYELAATDLSDTELVVLSACETGVGGQSGWHGSLSLQTAFLAAGAKSVVASKWSVDDAVTGRFMRTFYKRLKKGKTRSAALHAAMKSTRKSHPHPYYWAAFDLVGQRD